MVTHELIGDDTQAVVLTMEPGVDVRAEAGANDIHDRRVEMGVRMPSGLLGGAIRAIGDLLGGDR